MITNSIFRLLDKGGASQEAAMDMGNGYVAEVSVPATTNKTTIAYSTSTVQLLAPRPDYSRIGAVIINGGTTDLVLQDAGQTRISPGAAAPVEDPLGAMDGSWDAGGSGNAYVYEWVI